MPYVPGTAGRRAYKYTPVPCPSPVRTRSPHHKPTTRPTMRARGLVPCTCAPCCHALTQARRCQRRRHAPFKCTVGRWAHAELRCGTCPSYPLHPLALASARAATHVSRRLASCGQCVWWRCLAVWTSRDREEIFRIRNRTKYKCETKLIRGHTPSHLALTPTASMVSLQSYRCPSLPFFQHDTQG